MSRATINTGGVPFMESRGDSPSQANKKPCHILVLADFSGRSHRGMDDAGSLASRKLWEITRDNFEEVFYQMQVTLALSIANEPIRFHEFDELHPDFIYDRVDLFSKFRALKRKLKDKARFAEAAAEIQSWASAPKETQSGGEPAASAQDAASIELLDELLHSAQAKQAEKESIQGLIQSIVAPYVVPREDPRQPELMASVDQAAGHLMRKIMHSSAFQALESSWRGLYWLMRRLELDNNLRLYIADVSFAELMEDNQQHENSSTQLHQRLIEQRAAEGAVPFSYIVADYSVEDQLDHCEGLANLASVAADTNGLLFMGASEKVAGCQSLAATPDPNHWQANEDFQLLWNAIREQEYSQYVALTAPRFLLRLPYGKRTSPTENLEFEELPDNDRHAYYLWGNSIWMLASVAGAAYSAGGMHPGFQKIADLPLHVQQVDGESRVTPCAEILMVDRAAAALEHLGLTVVRSVTDQDHVLLPSVRSLHESQEVLATPWVYSQ